MMEPHQQRVVEEKEQLDAKILKLFNFIQENSLFASLPVIEQELLTTQLSAMRVYSDILGMRISAFK